jgi:hypothetical protein
VVSVRKLDASRFERAHDRLAGGSSHPSSWPLGGADFQRAVQQGNVMRAEAAARQLGHLSLEHALRLLFLYAEKEPIKYERAALRWLGRYVIEGKAVSLLKTQLALAALSELRTGSREAAAKLLMELVRR